MGELVDTCWKCTEHYLRHRDSLDYVFQHFARTSATSADDVQTKYFDMYHNRGHRKALRDDA